MFMHVGLNLKECGNILGRSSRVLVPAPWRTHFGLIEAVLHGDSGLAATTPLSAQLGHLRLQVVISGCQEGPSGRLEWPTLSPVCMGFTNTHYLGLKQWSHDRSDDSGGGGGAGGAR